MYYEILLRPTFLSPEGEREREGQNDLKSSGQKKERIEKGTSVLSSNILSLSLLSTMPTCHNGSGSI